MLNDLVDAIATVQGRIRDHRDYFATGGHQEWRTRVSLIDPVLAALGWDVGDPEQVRIEPKTKNGWADYALVDGEGQEICFVEAKKLGTVLEPIQVVTYAFQESWGQERKVPYCAVTDGNKWILLDVEAQREILATEITHDGPAQVALRLVSLWRDSLLSGGFQNVEVLTHAASEPAVSVSPPEQAAETEPKALPSPPATAPGQVTKTRQQDDHYGTDAEPTQEGLLWIPLDQFDPGSVSKAAQLRLRLPDGTVNPVGFFWWQLPYTLAEWSVGQGLIRGPESKLNGRRTFFIADHANTRPDGMEYRGPVKLGNAELWLSKWHNKAAHFNYAINLARHFEIEMPQVAVHE